MRCRRRQSTVSAIGSAEAAAASSPVGTVGEEGKGSAVFVARFAAGFVEVDDFAGSDGRAEEEMEVDGGVEEEGGVACGGCWF